MSIKQTLRSFVLQNYLFTDDDSALSDDDSFLEKGIIDSTGILELISFLESELGVEVEDEEMIPENLDSIDLVVAFIERKKGAAA